MRSFLVALLLLAAPAVHAAPDGPPVHDDILLAQNDAPAPIADALNALAAKPEAPAPATLAPPSWQAQLLMVLVGFVGLVLTGLATPIAFALARKLHLDAKVVEAAHVDDIVQRAVHYAEEQSNKAIAAKLPPKPGQEKLDLAAKFVAEQLAGAKLPEKGADAIKALVESKIGEGKAAVAL